MFSSFSTEQANYFFVSFLLEERIRNTTKSTGLSAGLEEGSLQKRRETLNSALAVRGMSPQAKGFPSFIAPSPHHRQEPYRHQASWLATDCLSCSFPFPPAYQSKKHRLPPVFPSQVPWQFISILICRKLCSF